jgi:hypothetical protein
MKMTLTVVSVMLLLSIAVLADEKKPEGPASNGSPKLDLSIPDLGVDTAGKVEGEPLIKRAENPEIPKSLVKRNTILMMALWASTAMDIQSSKRLDPTRFHEVNKFGGTGGQIVTSAVATGAAFLVERYANRRMRWLSSLLLGGAAAGHAFGAVHNYSLK